MDVNTSETFEEGVWKIKSSATKSKAILRKIASLHSDLLPETPSSKAGISILESLYNAIANDPKGIILLGEQKNQDPTAFASGTTSLRLTEMQIRNSLNAISFLKVLIFNILDPSHLLARFQWESTIPKQNIGFILTLGAKNPNESKIGIRGHEILKVLEHEFLVNDCKEVWVDTESKNAGALDFYRRNNYVLVRRSFGHSLLKKSI